MIIRIIKFLFVFGAIFLLGSIGSSLSAQCDPNVPFFSVDLSSSPDTTWTSPDTLRAGLCCGNSNPARCVSFSVILHPNASSLSFDIVSGAIPPGALFWQINCGPPTSIDSSICVVGVGPHLVTFCKSGNNTNSYQLISNEAPNVGIDFALWEGCSGQLVAENFDTSTIIWSSIPSDPILESYLSCTSCDTVNVVSAPGYPPFVDYQVCGAPADGCGPNICDTIRVNFTDSLMANINPQDPIICFGGPPTITLDANPSLGWPPYTFVWSTLETTQTIDVGPGTYWVDIADGTPVVQLRILWSSPPGPVHLSRLPEQIPPFVTRILPF